VERAGAQISYLFGVGPLPGVLVLGEDADTPVRVSREAARPK
jgi:hypothetical protein